MLSGGLAQLCSAARLAERSLLARFRLLLPDLENPSGTDARAGVFQVRHAVSDASESSVFRKSDLRRNASHSQISAT